MQVKDGGQALPAARDTRSGWYNLFRLRCFMGGCPCRTTPLDSPFGWYCVDCGEIRGLFDDDHKHIWQRDLTARSQEKE